MDLLTRGALLAGAMALVACRPDLDQRASRVTGLRVLAVRADPAEAEPRDAVAFSALVVGPEGATREESSWGFCSARKPLAELGPVNPACYVRDAATSTRGARNTVDATMPGSACRDFGPDVPQAKPGEPFGRPVDPDPTGGYYQPLTLFVGDEVAVAQARIACGVAGAPSEDVVTFRQRYHFNANPEIGEVQVDGKVAATDPVAVGRGARIAISVSWPACPAADTCGDAICGPDETREACPNDCARPGGCGGAERYLWFDPDARRLIVRREELRVSWFATAGLFDQDRTGRSEGDTATATDNGWVAPSAPGQASVWIVLRDSRGGVSWRRMVLDVR